MSNHPTVHGRHVLKERIDAPKDLEITTPCSFDMEYDCSFVPFHPDPITKEINVP